MRIAILTFDGFNELDSFIALGLLNRLKADGWKAEIASPSSHVTSMNGVVVEAQQTLEFANEADAVIFGSGIYTRAIAENSALLDRLQLDPLRQLIAAQCSGTLLLARLGLLADMPACTDLTTKPWVVQAGVRVVDAPFHAKGPIATAGGCLASQYLAAWMMAKRAGFETAASALHYAAPVGEKDEYVERLLKVVRPFIDEPAG
ncbi:DJ-1/PfpI family protein [Piscinibacter sp. XHJ-5]|uniref:DJ-1/PfpI family protein n=1 Tax=Piscinibacter sp. XHJ-5 TaxID=3037797 RepID=UPI002452BB38|nr:DJ-1/PfpI family protein [Piscinibacter sp. XHJ-5]